MGFVCVAALVATRNIDWISDGDMWHVAWLARQLAAIV